MLRRMIVPAGFAAILGLFAPAALADGEKRTSVQDENRVESFDRALEPRAPRSHRRMAVYSHGHHAHRRHAHRTHDLRASHGLHPRRHLFVAGMSGHGWPGVVNVATVTYRTHVYYTPAYPSVSYGYPPYAHLYDLTPGPIYNKPCFC